MDASAKEKLNKIDFELSIANFEIIVAKILNHSTSELPHWRAVRNKSSVNTLMLLGQNCIA